MAEDVTVEAAESAPTTKEKKPRRRGKWTLLAAAVSLLATGGMAVFAWDALESARSFDIASKGVEQSIAAQRERIETQTEQAITQAKKERDAEIALAAKVVAACSKINYFNRGSLGQYSLEIPSNVLDRMETSCPNEYQIVSNYWSITSDVLGGVKGSKCTQSNYSSVIKSDGSFKNKSKFALDIEIEATFFSGGTTLDVGTALLTNVRPGEKRVYTIYGSDNGYRLNGCEITDVLWWPSK